MQGKTKIGVVGAGSWGTALAISLAKKGHDVSIWDIDENHIKNMQIEKENKKYLPNIKLPDNLIAKEKMEEALKEKKVILFAAPAQHFRSAITKAKDYINEETILVNVAKGIEQKSLKRMSEIASEITKCKNYVCLSGPSHAEEVAQQLPTTIVVTGENKIAEYVQDIFITDMLRVYTGNDMVGVEVGGALKNIIALGAGISDGMGYGDNAKAAMMTRGLAEITRLGIKLGANHETFAGLTGIGDLIVTCTSKHSRNRKCGIMIGEGIDPEIAIKRVGMVVEGIYTTEAAYELSKKENIEMPITEGIYKIIRGIEKPEKVVNSLMQRERKSEEIGEYEVE